MKGYTITEKPRTSQKTKPHYLQLLLLSFLLPQGRK